MRIGYDAKRLFCNFTGLGNYSRTLVNDLQGLFPQHEYYLYTTKIKEALATNRFTQDKSFHIKVSQAKIKALWRSMGIVEQLKQDQIDLYHGLSNELPLTIRKSNIKSLVTIHDLIFKPYPHTYGFFDRQIYDYKFKQACRDADRVIAISQSTKNDLIQYYDIPAEKIDVVYQSCGALFFDDTVDDAANAVFEQHNIPKDYLLSVGSIIERKNLGLLIEAYAQLPSSIKIPLVVVGQGKQYKEVVKKLVSYLGLNREVIWIENLADNRQLKALYQGAQALVYPSRYEGFGLPVAEALLCKTPAITSNVSSLPEAGGPSSMLVNPDNAEELADAIQQVLEDTELRTKMINDGYQYAIQHFSGEVVAKQMMEVYQKTVDA